jgi:hypothetical protein
MADATFPSLPGLAFESSIPGSEVLARYRASDGAARTVERRAGGPGGTLDALPANDLEGVVARVLEVHAVGSERFLVYADDVAEALPAKLQDRQWSPVARLRALEALARGLRALHARGITHGDLTPDALFFLADGSMRIAALEPVATPSAAMSAAPSDARTFGPTLNRIRATGGALAYLAPEQFMANTTLPESDVFAWGCIAYEVATGRTPFGFLTDPAKLLDAMTRGPQRPVHELTRAFSHELDGAIRAALLVDRKQRALPSEIPSAWCAAEAGAPREGLPTAPRTSTSRAPIAAIVMMAVAAAIAYAALGR